MNSQPATGFRRFRITTGDDLLAEAVEQAASAYPATLCSRSRNRIRHSWLAEATSSPCWLKT